MLPEGIVADPHASLLVRMLELKEAHLLTSTADVTQAFTLALDRKQNCTDEKHFDDFAKEHPDWGMPTTMVWRR